MAQMDKTQPIRRANWDAALAAFRAASDASDEYWRQVEKPARNELDRTHPYPGATFTVHAADGTVGSLRWYEDKPDAYEKCFPPVRDAARAYRDRLYAWADARARLNLDAIHEESNERMARVAEAEDVLFETPAPDLAAVALKLERLWSDDRDSIPDFNELVLADVRRLAGLIVD